MTKDGCKTSLLALGANQAAHTQGNVLAVCAALDHLGRIGHIRAVSGFWQTPA